MNGQTTCVEAVRHYLDKISASSHLNAWLEVYEVEALETAALLDKQRHSGSPLGRLHGVIVGIKDVICHKDHKVSAASRVLENFTSVYSATATDRLLADEAIIIGRQNCDEFAMGSSNENSAYGPVRNAIDEERVPGGSSGGSAVAVQAGMCMVSLGSDTGGSVRQPADFCGIVGMKPSYGSISRYGLIAYASSFDQIGILAKNVDDVKLVLDVIAGADEFDSTVKQKPSHIPALKKSYRFCYFQNALEHSSLDPTISEEIKGFIKKLTGEGHTVEPVAFDLLDYIVPTYYVLTTAEASSNLSRYDGVKYGYRNSNKENNLNELYQQTRSEGFGPEVKRRILLGTFVLSAGYFDAYFTKAQKVRRLLVDKTLKIFEEYDAIILPTVPTPAYKIGEKKDPVEIFLADIYTVYANLVGIPAISLPLFKNDKGLPFGLQLMSSQNNELHLLSLSKLLINLRFSGK
ncbi:Asp-tRNA(Asn)/Glu-tRNA(Gln) amidotransferase subunit GatA [Segetibacter aerophilus]|uniref:Glutamyl-tRNA(Gln) amidotransferase subunit A n=1 Tax=Segetibacter aerophilus TaxID=670293 RepID=A0A512BF90_9BACT|nr:Asp-tRNA(Asn)/Glu-tRNA(Gln) amidotransferase subunit GatA [Segetibacter aerophilus]GEO10638.1 glutamyl-tRNA(Gln) amidotransferase subunit A [Segetibacter aerophilus]